MHKITKLICFRKLRQYFLLIIILANIFTSIAFFSNNLQFQSTKSDCIDSIEFNSLERKNPVHSGTIDSPLIINEPFSSLINQKKIIDVDEDKALYAYNLTLSQINQTKNMVENSQMDNDIDNLLKHWTMKSTSNKTNGLQLEYAQLDDNMVLNFSINGSEGNEIFSPFKNNNYTEFFYDCDSWEINYINSSTNFNLSCTEDSIFDSPDSKMGSSKMVSSKISNLFPTKNETYSSELNHTFF